MPPIGVGRPLKRYDLSAIPFLEKRTQNTSLIDTSMDMQFSEIFGAARNPATGQNNRLVPFAPEVGPVNNWTFSTWAKDSVQRPIVLTGATITGNGTTEVTVNLADMPSIRQLRRNDILWANGKNAFVRTADRTNVDNPTYKLRATDGSALTLPTSGNVYKIGVAFGSGAAPAENLIYGYSRFYQYMQIHREHNEYTDVAGRTPIEVEYNGSIYAISYQEMMKAISLMKSMSASCIASQITPVGMESSTPSLSDFESKAVQTQRGIDQYVTSYGIQTTVNAPGTLAGGDLNTLAFALRAAKAPLDYIALGGMFPRIVFSNYFKTTTGSGGLTQGRLSLDGRTIDLMMDGVTLPSGHRIQLVDSRIFDDVDGIGGIPYFANSQYLIPSGNAAVFGGGSQAYLRMRYLDPQYDISADSGRIERTNGLPIRVIEHGGVSKNATAGTNDAKKEWTCYASIEMVAANHAVKWTLANN